MKNRSSDLVSIRAAMRRAILDHGHIETSSINGIHHLAVCGQDGRLIAEFTPNTKRYDAALLFWLGLDTHSTRVQQYKRSTKANLQPRTVRTQNPLRYRATGKNPEQSTSTQDAIRRYDSQF